MSLLYAQSAPISGGGVAAFLPFLLIGLIFYFLILRPQSKQKKEYEGKSILWRNIGPGFIVAGLVCLTFQSKSFEMSNSVKLTLLIGTMYMVANLLGYDMPGVDAAVGFGFGG